VSEKKARKDNMWKTLLKLCTRSHRRCSPAQPLAVAAHSLRTTVRSPVGTVPLPLERTPR